MRGMTMQQMVQADPLVRQQLLAGMLTTLGLQPHELKPALVWEWFGERAEKLWPRDSKGESRKLYRDLFEVRGRLQSSEGHRERLKRAADEAMEIGVTRARRKYHVDSRCMRDEMRRRGLVYVNHGHRGENSGWFAREKAKTRRAA